MYVFRTMMSFWWFIAHLEIEKCRLYFSFMQRNTRINISNIYKLISIILTMSTIFLFKSCCIIQFPREKILLKCTVKKKKLIKAKYNKYWSNILLIPYTDFFLFYLKYQELRRLDEFSLFYRSIELHSPNPVIVICAHACTLLIENSSGLHSIDVYACLWAE